MKYVLAVTVGAGTIALLSLLWPKVTTSTPPPPGIREVRDTVLGTEIGQTTANLLGISDRDAQPVNMTDTLSSVAGAVTTSIEQRVQQIVSDQVAAQLIKQYEQLPTVQRDRVEDIICKPKE